MTEGTAPAPRPPAAPGSEQELHDFVMDFGTHKGARLVRVPIGYLKWMVANNARHAALAEREMARRGTPTPTLDITSHAIDRASLHCRDKWHEERIKTGLGLHSWLVKVATEALAQGDKKQDGRIVWKGMKFAFKTETEWPILMTVRPDKQRRLDSVKQKVQHQEPHEDKNREASIL